MRSVILAGALMLAACATGDGGQNAAAPACEVSAEDRAWIDASLEAWRFSAREITGVGAVRPFDAVFFDDDCVLTSANAFTAERVADVVWSATPHAGEVPLPDGGAFPAGLTSFSSGDGERAFFVMSTPSIWRAAGVANETLGLETMMTGVLRTKVHTSRRRPSMARAWARSSRQTIWAMTSTTMSSNTASARTQSSRL